MTERKLRVLQVIDSLGMGGAETWLMAVLRHWAASGAASMDFLATGGRQGLFDDEARRLGARIHYVRYGRGRLLQFAREFRQILRRGHYDAIHDHQDYSSGWHFALGAGALPPVRVTHVHNPSYQILNNYGVTLGRRNVARVGRYLVSRFATHITGTSRQVLKEYRLDTRRFSHLPKGALHCGFDTGRFAGDIAAHRASVREEMGWPTDAKIVLFAGRIDQSPDIDHPQNHKKSPFAVAVGIEAARRDPRLHMLLAGATSLAVPVLEQRIAAAGLSQRIRFLGVRRVIERLMMASDVLLFPSRGEGLGMVAVEAQAAGLPVLASHTVPRECVVVPELVWFQGLDSGIELWVSDLLELAAQPRNPAVAQARVRDSAFSIENSSSALLRLYREGKLG